MKTSALPRSLDINVGPQAEDPAGRLPDAAIRANAEIMQASTAAYGKMVEASRAGGLQLVVNGTAAEAARPPQQISGLNGTVLAGLGLAGAIAGAATRQSPQETPKAATPAAPSQPAPKTPQPASPAAVQDPPAKKQSAQNPKVEQKPAAPAKPKPAAPAVPAAPAAKNPSNVPAQKITLPPVLINSEDFEP